MKRQANLDLYRDVVLVQFPYEGLCHLYHKLGEIEQRLEQGGQATEDEIRDMVSMINVFMLETNIHPDE